MTDRLIKIFLLCAVLAVALLNLASCKKKEAASERKERVFAVVTQPASVSEVQGYIDINGEVRCKTNVAIYPEIGGKVVQLDVELGDKVKKNQIVAYVDPSKPGYTYAKSPVKATISGTVTRIASRVGTSVSTGTEVITVGDIDNLVLYADIPERDVGSLAVNLKADVFLPSYPDGVFKAHIVRISPVVDPDSRSKEIELAFDVRDSRINAGMFPKLRLYTTVYSGNVVVSENSVVTRGGQDYVYLAKKDASGADIAVRVPVECVATVDGRSVVADGISVGDEVVVDGMDVLTDGAKINILRK